MTLLLHRRSLQPLFGSLGNSPEGIIAKGSIKPRSGNKSVKGLGSAKVNKLHIAGKSLAPVPLHNSPELQSNGLCKAVINIIEWALVDVGLSLPCSALAVER